MGRNSYQKFRTTIDDGKIVKKISRPYRSLYLYRNDVKKPTLFEYTEYDENILFVREFKVIVFYDDDEK